ncbi:MAG: GTPase Era [Solirubrobacteraceae bacterium]
MTRAGFVALAGRPNVGKSTFLNAVVGHKVAIVSDRPQTTRRAVRGVARRGQTQIVFVDLPGVQRPRDLLTERMASTVEAELGGADVALMILNGEQGTGPGDRFIAEALASAGRPVAVAVNKADRLNRTQAAEALLAAEQLLPRSEIFPISARRGSGIEPLLAHLAGLMPEGPFLYPDQERSDQPLELLIAELVREAAIRRTFDELPHALEVAIEELSSPRDGLTRVGALIWVETESQKRIVIGAGGKMVKSIGVAARRELQRELGVQVHLDLIVRVRRDWRGEPALLDRLGIG